MESIIAINITVEDKLINKDNIPYCFYWNGEGNIDEVIKSKEHFINHLLTSVLNKENYSKSNISYFYYDGENYVSNNKPIQDWITLDELSNINKLYLDYIIYYFNYLYNCSYKKDYDFSSNINDDILKIYKEIEIKYPNKIAKETVIGYIRSELIKKENLNNQNIEYIISNINQLIN